MGVREGGGVGVWASTPKHPDTHTFEGELKMRMGVWKYGSMDIPACAVASLVVLAVLAGCASLAVTRCDTIEDRDGKYFGRFFLGVATLGLSEVTIQQEEVRQAYEGSPSCPPPQGVRVVTAAKPASSGGQSVAVGTLVNGAPWTIGVYLNQEPGTPGVAPFTILRPQSSIQIAFRPGQYAMVARPTGAPPGTLPDVTWRRQMEIDPRVRGFKLQFNEADFK